jgi:hypothetical protein
MKVESIPISDIIIGERRREALPSSEWRLKVSDIKTHEDFKAYLAERGLLIPNRMRLTRGFFARIDEEDFIKLWDKKWTYLASKSGTGYAVHHYRVNGKSYSIMMHRFLMNAPRHMTVDHINGDGLDNRRCNLRLATPGENSRNRKPPKGSKFKGVHKSKSLTKPFLSRITVEARSIYLGSFETPEEAARVYDDAARLHHGEFARLNFPIGENHAN